MNYLVDTHALLWMMFEPKKLSQNAKEVFTGDENIQKYDVPWIW